MFIRKIRKEDNESIEKIIRKCLTEFGANREGFAWSDPELSCLSEVYKDENTEYWVVEKDGKILGGCGIAPMKELKSTCELQKMYLLKDTRGTGIGSKLMETALDFSKQYYDKCYLETLQIMKAANKFYLKHGFEKLDKPIIETEHFACDTWYIKYLK